MTTQGTEARSAETTGSARKGDGPVAESDAPDHPTATDWRNRAERSEAECKELRAERTELEAMTLHAQEAALHAQNIAFKRVEQLANYMETYRILTARHQFATECQAACYKLINGS